MGGGCAIVTGGKAGGDRFKSIFSGDDRLSGLGSRPSSLGGPVGPLTLFSKPGGMSRILCVNMCCFMFPW